RSTRPHARRRARLAHGRARRRSAPCVLAVEVSHAVEHQESAPAVAAVVPVAERVARDVVVAALGPRKTLLLDRLIFVDRDGAPRVEAPRDAGAARRTVGIRADAAA